MRAKRADGGVEPRLCYLPSTPQSIAKPSPGWNKVALLTAVRNSPCSCPFSVSLHPPLAALNSEPRPGSLLAFCNHHPKAVPVYGGFEPSAPGGRCSEGRIGRNREYCKRQRSKTTIFQPAFVAANVMSSRKGNGLELLTAASCSPPQLRLRSAAPPHAVAPFGALYKLIHKQQRGRIASPYLHNLLCSPAARRISHCASNISLRISAISPVRKNGFHRGRKPPTSPFLPGQRSGSRRPPRCRW